MKHARKVALRISIIYIIIGAVWILISDNISRTLAQGRFEVYIFFQQYKGWFFILATGIILYGLVYRRAYKLVESQQELVVKEHELQTSNQHYQSLFKHNPDGVFEISKTGEVLLANPEGEAIVEYSSEELQKMKPSALIAAEEFDMCKEYFKEVLNGKGAKFEMNVINRKRERRLLRCSLLPIIVHKQVVGVFMIARDITTYRQDEELMITSEKMSVIGQMAGAVAHEIRNPLTSLKGFVQVMQASKETNDTYLDIMMSEIDRINLISSEMLILGKKQHVSFEKTNLCEILKQVITLMEAQANLNNVSILLKETAKRPIYVSADANQLKQVFINVIKNGVEAIMEKGHITITVEEKDTRALIHFEDNGIGMSQERIEQVGTPFYSTKEAGTGLGLAVCYKIMERHQGTMHFKSGKGKGTTVTIDMPIIERNSRLS